MRTWIAAIALLAGSLGSAQAAPKPVAPLLKAVTACQADLKPLMEKVVAIDSGTGDAEGLAAVGRIFGDELRALGLDVRFVPPVAPGIGDNVVATWTGAGKGRILLVPHMDTVFNRGDVAARKPRWDGERYIGPGAGDDKSGAVTAICALRGLKAIGYRGFARVDLLINSNEETGSFGSRDLIRSMARESDAAIALERGVPPSGVVVSRKGSANLRIDVTGRAAHAGLEPEKGRNAALEAARIALALRTLQDTAAGTTVTVTILSGGDKTNVVPDQAVVRADVRAFSAAEFQRVEAGARRLATDGALDGTSAKVALTPTFPGWPRAASTDALLARANRLAAELGVTLSPVVVGSSGDVALAAEAGIPVIDGFAMEGGGAHGVDDYADFGTLPARAYILARMLMDLGANPPAK